MRDWLNPLLHALGGAVATGLILVGFHWSGLEHAALLAALLSMPVLAVFGWLRETMQHDLRLSAWQWLEALAWPLGSLAAVLAW
jgi:hypothetical protein